MRFNPVPAAVRVALGAPNKREQPQAEHRQRAKPRAGSPHSRSAAVFSFNIKGISFATRIILGSPHFAGPMILRIVYGTVLLLGVYLGLLWLVGLSPEDKALLGQLKDKYTKKKGQQ